MAGRNCCKCVTVSLVPTASLILVILFACGIVLLPILYIELAHDYKYGVIIDAGSSHTTLYGYRWRVPTHNKTGVIEVKEIYQCPVKRSLNSYAFNPKYAGDAFQTCLVESQNSKPLFIADKDGVRYTPVYLGATAGMRILDMTDKAASNEIMNEVRKVLKNSNYSFSVNQARIISGVEEAIGGWTTANYLYRNLNPPSQPVGSLDLGGASAEIAFNVSDDSYPSETLFDQKYNIFARSYLCYGQNEAHARFLAHLHNKAGGNNTVENPCMINGFNISYHHSNVYTGCVNITSSAAIEAFGFGYAPPTSLGADDDITFVGMWNRSVCLKEIKSVFNFSQCLPENNCQQPGNNFTLPPVTGPFVGFSAFYWTASYFNQSKSLFNKTYSWDKFSDVVATNCSKSRNNSCIVNSKMRRSCYQNCFNGLFSPFLLEYGFGFSNKSASNWSVEFKQKVADVSVGWALGYMLNQTNIIPQNHFTELRPYTPVDLVVGIIILSILCVVFVIFFFLTFYACRKALRARSGFQPL